jgi:hypothetical protein
MMIAIKANASNAIHVPNVLSANAAQSHPNCRPSDRIATIPRNPLLVPTRNKKAYCQQQGSASNFCAFRRRFRWPV